MDTARRRHNSQRSRSSQTSTSYASTHFSESATVNLDRQVSRTYSTGSQLQDLREGPNPTENGSTDTLIEPPASLNLVFDRNSVIDATLYSRRNPVYRIKTNRNVTRTVIHEVIEGGEEIVAVWKRREILPDVILFTHRRKQAIRISKWLQKFKPPGVRYGLFL